MSPRAGAHAFAGGGGGWGHLERRFEERDDCVQCDGGSPSCNCAAGEQCILTSRTCSSCASIKCLKASESSTSSSINPGVIAGPIVAVLVVASLALFWWLRKKKRRDLARLEELAVRARKAESAGFHLSAASSPHPSQPTSPRSATSQQSQQQQQRARSPLPPAPVNAEYYDDHGATIRVYGGKSGGTIHVGGGKDGDDRNPFADRQSVSTQGTGMSGQSTNIIPIRYIPPSNSQERMDMDDRDHDHETAGGGRRQSVAARTLNEARQNLLTRPPNAPPRRPARSPDLDLRLNPPVAMPDGYLRGPTSPAGTAARDSYMSGTSGAPSFLSGMSYDIHSDAPRIFTSKQVHVGTLHQAEVVDLSAGKPRAGAEAEMSDAATFGAGTGHLAAAGGGGGRTLTPTATRRVDSPTDGQGEYGEEPSSAGSADLRFSMGSLAYRDSVSTMGTGRYLAQPQSVLPSPRKAPGFGGGGGGGERESMFSTKSYADSVLSGFPMITPGAAAAAGPSHAHPALPQSSSVATLDHLAARPPPPPPPPPPAYNNNVRVPQGGGGASGSRPVTATSVADSFLGTFPFVPPNVDDLAGLPSAALPSGVLPGEGGKGK